MGVGWGGLRLNRIKPTTFNREIIIDVILTTRSYAHDLMHADSFLNCSKQRSDSRVPSLVASGDLRLEKNSIMIIDVWFCQ